jgi:diguanylate cyclase (GGDEF)-like protein
LRERDLIGRFGGEEFVVLLPGVDLERAERLAERLRNKVAEAPIRTEERTVAVTISLGVASRREGTGGLTELLREADEALYAAKRAGRNRVEAQCRVKSARSPVSDVNGSGVRGK